MDLLGREDFELDRGVGLNRFLDVGDRVARQLPDALGALHDPEQARQDPQSGRVGQAASGEAGRPDFDLLGAEVLQAPIAERRQQVRPHDRFVAADRGRLAAAVLLEPAHVLGDRVGECGARADHPRELTAARLVEHVGEPPLGRALGEVAGARSPALGPRGSDAALTCRPSGRRYLAYQTSPREPRRRTTCPVGVLNRGLCEQRRRGRRRSTVHYSDDGRHSPPVWRPIGDQIGLRALTRGRGKP